MFKIIASSVISHQSILKLSDFLPCERESLERCHDEYAAYCANKDPKKGQFKTTPLRVQDKNGQVYYLKQYGQNDLNSMDNGPLCSQRAILEKVGGDLYRLLGITAPSTVLVEGPNGETWVASQEVKGKELGKTSPSDCQRNELDEIAIAAVFLGDTDAIGRLKNNVMLDDAGKIHKIDFGNVNFLNMPNGDIYGKCRGGVVFYFRNMESFSGNLGQFKRTLKGAPLEMILRIIAFDIQKIKDCIFNPQISEVLFPKEMREAIFYSLQQRHALLKNTFIKFKNEIEIAPFDKVESEIEIAPLKASIPIENTFCQTVEQLTTWGYGATNPEWNDPSSGTKEVPYPAAISFYASLQERSPCMSVQSQVDLETQRKENLFQINSWPEWTYFRGAVDCESTGTVYIGKTPVAKGSGWKLHLSIDSSEIENFENAVECLLPTLMDPDFGVKAFKIHRNPQGNQTGKNLVIYMPENTSPEQWEKLTRAIEMTLQTHKIKEGRAISCDLKIGESNYIFARNDTNVITGAYFSEEALRGLGFRDIEIHNFSDSLIPFPKYEYPTQKKISAGPSTFAINQIKFDNMETYFHEYSHSVEFDKLFDNKRFPLSALFSRLIFPGGSEMDLDCYGETKDIPAKDKPVEDLSKIVQAAYNYIVEILRCLSIDFPYPDRKQVFCAPYLNQAIFVPLFREMDAECIAHLPIVPITAEMFKDKITKYIDIVGRENIFKNLIKCGLRDLNNPNINYAGLSEEEANQLADEAWSQHAKIALTD